MEPKTGHSSQGVLLVAALIFSVIAGNGPLVSLNLFNPAQTWESLTVLRGAGPLVVLAGDK